MWPPGLCTLPALGAASAVVESTGRTGHGGLLIWFVHFHWVKQVEQYTHTHIYIYNIQSVCMCIYVFFLLIHVLMYIYICIFMYIYICIYIYIDKTQQLFLTNIYQQMVITALATSGVAVELSKKMCFYIILFHLVGHALLIPTPLILRVTSQ